MDRPAAGTRRPVRMEALLIHVLFRLVVMAGLVVLGVVFIVLVFQNKFIFAPTRPIEQRPADVLLDYEEVRFPAADGVMLHGWFVPAESPKATVLLCHGNAGNISHRLFTLELFHRLGLQTLIFDYRGYGRSEGAPSEAGLYADAEGAWDYLTDRRGLPPGRIVLFGRSLGGSLAARLAARHGPAGLVLDSAFTSMPKLAGELYWHLPVHPLIRAKFETIADVRRVRCPVLVAHSRDDEMIRFEHARRLYETACEPKQLLELTGGHNEGMANEPEKYGRTIVTFIEEATARSDGISPTADR